MSVIIGVTDQYYSVKKKSRKYEGTTELYVICNLKETTKGDNF